jgi:hypothetical protein
VSIGGTSIISRYSVFPNVFGLSCAVSTLGAMQKHNATTIEMSFFMVSRVWFFRGLLYHNKIKKQAFPNPFWDFIFNGF